MGVSDEAWAAAAARGEWQCEIDGRALAPPPPIESDEWVERVKRWPQEHRDDANAKAALYLRARDAERVKAAAGEPHDKILAGASARWLRWSIYVCMRGAEGTRELEPPATPATTSDDVISLLEGATKRLGQRVSEGA